MSEIHYHMFWQSFGQWKCHCGVPFSVDAIRRNILQLKLEMGKN